ncbi:acyl-coenzyme A oxidase-like protein [Urocitellus parryii]
MEPAQDLGLGDSSLNRYLDGEFWSLKNELRRLLGGCPLFRHRYGLSLDEMRALTVQRVKFILGHPLVKRAFQEQAEKTKNFVNRGLVIGEVLSTADLATSVKGYMMENRISDLKCDADVFVTFEGDNVVMLQVVARELLAQYTKQHKDQPLSGLLWSWVASVSDKLRTSFLACNTDAIGNLAFLLKAVNFRERVLQRYLVARIYYKVVTKKEDFFHAWNSCLHHITLLSLAHTHRVTLEQFSLAVRSCPDPQDQALLMKFCLLYGTKLVFQERAWYLEQKYLTPRASSRIRNQLLDLCDSVKDDALRVVSAFNIPHTSLHAPIAGIPSPHAAWAFYPARILPLAGEAERCQRPKLGAKL